MLNSVFFQLLRQLQPLHHLLPSRNLERRGNRLDLPQVDLRPKPQDQHQNLLDLRPRYQLQPPVPVPRRERQVFDVPDIDLTSMGQVREGRGRPVKSKEIIDSSVDSGDEPTPGIITETVGSYTDEAGNKVRNRMRWCYFYFQPFSGLDLSSLWQAGRRVTHDWV